MKPYFLRYYQYWLTQFPGLPQAEDGVYSVASLGKLMSFFLLLSHEKITGDKINCLMTSLVGHFLQGHQITSGYSEDIIINLVL